MRTAIEKSNLVVNVYDVLEGLSAEDKMKLADDLSCTDDVINFVTQQIIERWTAFNSHGGVACIAPVEPVSGLDKAWRDVAKMSGEVAKHEIERLEDALKFQKEQNDKITKELSEVRAKAWRLERSL